MIDTMTESELKALVSLLDDPDHYVSDHVEGEIRKFGNKIIPVLESEWQDNSLNPFIQRRIEHLIHDLQFVQVSDRLTQWYAGGEFDLLEGLWIVATYQYPELTYEKLKDAVEQVFYEFWLDVKPDMHPIDKIKTMNAVFYGKLKFTSNTKHFHSPANSMLNIVLESRRGNPISLSCIYMLMARRLNIPLYGVNLPNLFVLTYKGEIPQFYINVFNKGLVFNRKDIEQYVAQLNLKPLDTFFEPCSNLDIVRRYFRNLIMAFEKTGDQDKVEEVKKLMRIISDEEN